MREAEPTRGHVADALRRHRAGNGVVGTLEGLCHAVSEDLALMGATVTLMPSVASHDVVACSSTVVRGVEEAQFGVGEGPTRDAFTTRRPVLVARLPDTGVRRWPGWTPTALTAGVCAVYALPLQVGASTFGVLTAYAGPSPGLGADGLATALVFSEAATEVLVAQAAPTDGSALAPDLAAALETNSEVYQAQGMVMVELGVGLPEALARMRAHAWATEQQLIPLAREILAGRAMPPIRDLPEVTP